MTDERWSDIHTKRQVWSPASPAPRPFVAKPTCAEHCCREGDQHETDSTIQCRICGTTMYRVILHEWSHEPGHYWHEVVPMNGAQAYDKTTTCCGMPLVRR